MSVTDRSSFSTFRTRLGGLAIATSALCRLNLVAFLARLAPLAAFCILNATANAAVTQIGTPVSQFGYSNSSPSWTVPAGSKRLLVVIASDSESSGIPPITAVTFGGTAMTRAYSNTSASGFSDSVWTLAMGSSITSTSGAVVMTTGASNALRARFLAAVTFAGVDQATPTESTSGADGTGGNSALNVLSQAGDMAMSVFDAYRNSSPAATLTVRSGQTFLTGAGGRSYSNNTGGYQSYGVSVRPGPLDPVNLGDTSQQVGWTSNGQLFVHVGLNIRAAATVSGYCTPVTTTGCTGTHTLSRFSLTGDGTTVNNDTGATCSANPAAYSDYTAAFPAVLLPRGNTFSGLMRTGDATDYATIWIDFNDNGVFEDSERLLDNLQIGTVDKLYGIQIPAGATPGVHRMRVRIMGSASTPTALTPACTTTATGETEDYLVEVTTDTVVRAVAAGTPGACAAAAAMTIGPGRNNSMIAGLPLVDASNNLVAAIYPNGNNLGTVSPGFYVHNAAVRASSDLRYYLDRNVSVLTQRPPNTPINLRLYYKNSELNALIAQPGSGVTSQFDLVATRSSVGACATAYPGGGVAFAPPTGFGSLAGDRFVDFTTLNSGGNFFLHGGGTILRGAIPSVLQNPTNQSVLVAGTATFTAMDLFSATAVKWQRSTDGGLTFSDISGAASPSYAVTNAQASQDGQRYRAVFSNSSGSVNTDSALLTVKVPPTIAYTALSSSLASSNRVLTVTIADATNVATGSVAPRIYANKNAGAFSSLPCSLSSGTVQSGTWACTIDHATLGGVVIGDVVRYFVVAQNEQGTVVANPSAGFVGTNVNTVTSPPTAPNQYRINPVIGSSIDVGASSYYTSLTNSGGVFDAINGQSLSGNVTVNIVSDLMAETGSIVLNQWTETGAGNYTLLIRPTGAPRVISGSSNTALIRLNDADRVTIDGSLSGGTASGIGGDASLRQLTITNTNTNISTGTPPISAVLAISGVVNGAQNNTFRNLNIVGQSPTTTGVGISLGGTVGFNGIDNDNNRVENCSVQKAIVGIYSGGQSTANPNVGTVIIRNDLSGTSGNRIRRVGILLNYEDGAVISENNIGGIDTDEGADAIGIGIGIQGISTTVAVGFTVANANVTRNRINGITGRRSSGFSAVGIAVAGGVGTNTIANNMITGVISNATTVDLVAGIFVAGVSGSSTRLLHNSIAMTGNRGATVAQTPSYGVAITGTDPTLELKNNIFYNTQDPGSGGANAKSYAIGTESTTFSSLNSNYNAFFTAGPLPGYFRTGSLRSAEGTDYVTLALWQAAVAGDANSRSVDPLFVNPASDVHLQGSSPLLGKGTLIAGISTDFDNDARKNPPDIGADEVSATLNIDGSSGTVYDPATDGLLLTRYLLGLRGAALIANARGTGGTLRDAAAIEAHIANNFLRFDVDGDGQALPLSDGLMIVRRLLNPTPPASDAAAAAAITAGAKRTARSDAEIVNAIDALRP